MCGPPYQVLTVLNSRGQVGDFYLLLSVVSHFRFCIISIFIIVNVLADAHGPAFVWKPEDRSRSWSSPTIGSRAELG